MRATLLVLTLAFSSISGENTHNKNDLQNQRDKKLLSLFSIVTFPNQGCSSLDADRNGTCYTSTECINKGGTKSGNCAAGFGVCCLFIVSATSRTINENCTYIQNPSFPSAYSSQTALTYTINKCSSDVCSVRLDFESFTIEGPADTIETGGGACMDSFQATGTSGIATPIICGMNTGQHIYVEMGNSGSTDTAMLAFTFNGASTSRTWEIKATQIPCGANYRQPEGCLQYHTELTGRFQTFNFADTTTPQHLANQNYGICIRQEDGYCCIKYSLCSDAMSYTLSHSADTGDGAMLDTNCVEDYLQIPAVQATCDQGPGILAHTKMCGGVVAANGNNVPFTLVDAGLVSLGSVCDCTAPFIAQIVTDATAGAGADPETFVQRGICLEYKQIPC